MVICIAMTPHCVVWCFEAAKKKKISSDMNNKDWANWMNFIHDFCLLRDLFVTTNLCLLFVLFGYTWYPSGYLSVEHRIEGGVYLNKYVPNLCEQIEIFTIRILRALSVLHVLFPMIVLMFKRTEFLFSTPAPIVHWTTVGRETTEIVAISHRKWCAKCCFFTFYCQL